jgi:hypothetical protein
MEYGLNGIKNTDNEKNFLYILIYFTRVTSSLSGMRSVDSRCEFLNSIKIYMYNHLLTVAL